MNSMRRVSTHSHDGLMTGMAAEAAPCRRSASAATSSLRQQYITKQVLSCSAQASLVGSSATDDVCHACEGLKCNGEGNM